MSFPADRIAVPTSLGGTTHRGAEPATGCSAVAGAERRGEARAHDRRSGGWHRAVARERRSAYETTDPAGTTDAQASATVVATSVTGTVEAGHASAAGEVSEAGRALEAAVAGMRALPVDELSESALAAEVAVLERACRQLSARQSRVMAALAGRRSRRAKDAAKAAGRGEHVAGERAARELRREMADRLGWTPAEAKRSLELGRQLQGDDRAGQAFDAGDLPARHATVLADTLKHLVGDPRRAAEAELVALASRQDPVEFGRSCRRLLARLDAAAAERADQRRQARRTTRMWHSEDGMTGFSASLSGLDAETVTTAWHAFRRPNAPDEHRTPEQAGADALVAMARAALDAGLAPHDRRTPPHVQVTIDWQHVLTGAGLPEGRFTGPLPAAQFRRLLADCGVSRLLVDAQGVPMEAGERSRTVPVGIHRSIEVRDRTCIGQNCDILARWCQVMHIGTPYQLDGRLTIDTAAMGCAHHHYAYDHLGWQITWHGRRPILHHPDRPPQSPDTEDDQPAASSGAADPAVESAPDEAGGPSPLPPNERPAGPVQLPLLEPP